MKVVNHDRYNISGRNLVHIVVYEGNSKPDIHIIARLVGYPPEGYGLYNGTSFHLGDNLYLFKWQSFNSCN